MRQEHPPLSGRDHMAYRGSFYPVKDTIDGDLCEQYSQVEALLTSALWTFTRHAGMRTRCVDLPAFVTHSMPADIVVFLCWDEPSKSRGS